MKLIRLNKPSDKQIEIKVAKEEVRELVLIVDGRCGVETPDFFEVKIKVLHVGDGGKALIKLRGVVSNGMKLRVKGIVEVVSDVRRVESSLEMRALILDKKSLVELNPDLEIKSKEVKVTHSASVGMIEEEEIEYLMSLGLNRERAKKQIVDGWLMVE